MRAIITIVILAIIAVAIYLYARDRNVLPPENGDQTSTTTQMRVYTNRDYNFTFEYPGTFAVQEYNPEHVAVGSSTNGGFNSAAEVTVLLGEEATTTAYASFEQFLADQARVMCAADGPQETIGCTDVARESEFESTTGLTGIEFYLTEQTRNLTSGTTTDAEKGPFFAFNLSANATGTPYAALVVHAPIAQQENEVNAALIRSIAQSVQIGRTETR